MIPSSFQLGGRTWTVAVVDDIESDDGALVWGRTSSSRAHIEILKAQSEESAQHTFYHELVHAICMTLGYGKLNKDEDKVDAIGNLLLQFEQTKVNT